jgi:cell wall-associated NlpC family hydrolase
MINSTTVKVSLCLSAALVSLSFPVTAEAAKETRTSDVGIAGITQTLDLLYSTASEQVIGEVESLVLKSDEISEKQTLTQVESPYANLGISIAENYVNIRKEPNTESDVVGKLYKGCATDILATEGEWVKIQSGKVNGYINAEFLAIGEEAEGLIDDYATKYATINTQTLFVREKPNTEATITTMVPLGETFLVLNENEGWAKIMIDEEETGFVSKDYITMDVEFEYAVSIEEEQAKLAAEEAARQAEAERLVKLAEQQEAARQAQAQSNSNNNTEKETSSSQNISSNPGNSSVGQEIADYAVKFVGNPYVWGGTSLTNGADCSGFVQSIYSHFGYGITRTSRDQAASAGREVSIDSRQPGDLIFYRNSSGVVNHVAIYIGNNKVVHASNAREGIKISSFNYRTPYKIRRIV